MKIDASLFRGDSAARVIISVDSAINGEPQGSFLSIFMQQPELFKGIVPMINGMDAYFDGVDYPQAFNAYRSFDTKQPPEVAPLKLELEPVSEELFSEKRGRLMTFLVQVIFRRNTDWQGIVTWLEQGKTQNFRSTLELMKLMDSAIRRSVGGEKSCEWFEET